MGGDTPVTTGGVMDMLERQQFRCALTGRELTPETAALDHIVPIRVGGRHVISNVQVLHKDVNRAKGSMPCRDFLDLCVEVATRGHATWPTTIAPVAEVAQGRPVRRHCAKDAPVGGVLAHFQLRTLTALTKGKDAT